MQGLYEVWDPGGDLAEDSAWMAVWANGHGEALELCLRCCDPNIKEADLCWRRSLVAGLTPNSSLPHVERRYAVLRRLGWRCEGDSSCETCGLYEMDGTAPVCGECHQCQECGCDCEDKR